MIKIEKLDRLVSLFFIMLLAVLFCSLARPAIALNSSNILLNSTLNLGCISEEVNNPTQIGFYYNVDGGSENLTWQGDSQCYDHISNWNEYGLINFPATVKLIEGSSLDLNNNCPFLTPEECQVLYGISPMGVVIIYENTLPGSTSVHSNKGTINVVKTVINDNGGTKVIPDFPLFVNGQAVISGQTYTFSAPGPVFSVTETGNSGYTTTFSGDCDTNGQFNLSGGDNKFCVVTNNDIGVPVVVPPIPPLINIVKVPSPLALPDGPGPVTYTYTIRNIGTVPVIRVTLVGDTCSPIVRVSGDTNSDSKLDVGERWVYRCTTILTETHTNTITATGWANGISTVDVAASTVVVGLSSVEPPLINVVKIPNTLVLPAGGGTVNYTNMVTNPGEVALNNVYLTADKCSPMKYVSGDRNSDLKLDINEMWTYTCQRNLTETTTDTVSARGEAIGLVARDLSVATVVVSATEIIPENIIPSLPDTGLSLDKKWPIELERSVFWTIIILVGVITILIIIYFFKKIKKYE